MQIPDAAPGAGLFGVGDHRLTIVARRPDIRAGARLVSRVARSIRTICPANGLRESAARSARRKHQGDGLPLLVIRIATAAREDGAVAAHHERVDVVAPGDRQ
jgi:hypothetical protein